MRILNEDFFSEASVAATTQTSSIDASHVFGVSVQIDWSGNSGTATATLQASNDGLTWINLPNTVSVTGASGVGMLYATDFWYAFVRVDLNVSSTVSNVRMRIVTKGQ